MMDLFFDALNNGASNAIENSEKRGQKDIVKNQRLPIKTNPTNGDIARLQYLRIGIEIIDAYDDLFYNVNLPNGWEIKTTEHPMWNKLFDDKGRERASFFYKASFYDREAFISFNTRYSFSIQPFDFYKDDTVSYEDRKLKEWYGVVFDSGKEIYRTNAYTPKNDKDYLWDKDNILRKQCIKYLVENFPYYEDIDSYWN